MPTRGMLAGLHHSRQLLHAHAPLSDLTASSILPISRHMQHWHARAPRCSQIRRDTAMLHLYSLCCTLRSTLKHCRCTGRELETPGGKGKRRRACLEPAAVLKGATMG